MKHLFSRPAGILLLLLPIWTECRSDDGAKDSASDRASGSSELQLYSFPSRLEPGGQATLTVVVRSELTDCADETCAVCLVAPPRADGEPPALFGGSLAESPTTSSTVRLLVSKLDRPYSIVYRGLRSPGSEVVMATLVRAASPCGRDPAVDSGAPSIVANTTMRIVTAAASGGQADAAVVDAAAETKPPAVDMAAPPDQRSADANDG